ncbi:hypothetical protein ACP70R_028687 [Stipagrostis hirtigluma subsp. patula]
MGSELRKLSMEDEALMVLEQPTKAMALPEERGGHDRRSLLTAAGFALLTFSAAMAVYFTNRGAGAVSFVGFSFLDVVMLFCCLRRYGGTPLGSPRREQLKVAAWLLTTMLTCSFFILLEFWFVTKGDVAPKIETTPHHHLHH